MRSRFSAVTRVASVGLLSLTLGIAQLPSVTARAQGDEQRASGPVVDLADGRATVATNAGPVVVQMGPDTQYERDTFGTLGDLQPGQFVGVTGRPTGDGLEAVEIHVFPALLSSVSQGQTPMSGANAGNTMTNASIVSLDGGILTLQFADQLVTIATTPATEVRFPGPATADDVQAGRRIVAAGPTGADGVIQARGVYVTAQ
jgi:Domain of unknown function (DUF5666)